MLILWYNVHLFIGVVYWHLFTVKDFSCNLNSGIYNVPSSVVYCLNTRI
jgi:thiamine transporter ThiT